jgi:5'-deoxynucleotidase YfbR-like HD superfamily hydrolase
MYALKTKQERVKFLREAADVQRLHVIRTIGEYSNAQHSFNMLAMLRVLWPDAPVSLVWAILEHDIPERIIGDVPSPSLRNVFSESAEAVEAEECAVLDQVFPEYTCSISLEESKWLKALDLFELYLYAKDQFMLGNRNLETMRMAIEDRFKRDAAKIPPAILNLYHECKNSDWTYLPDLGVDR